MSEAVIRKAIHDYIVATWLSGDDRDFSDDTDLLQAGILDSFTTLNLAAFLDESFHAVLDAAEINPQSFRSVNSLTQTVLAKLGPVSATR